MTSLWLVDSDAPAVIAADGSVVSYQQLRQLAFGAQHFLRDVGVAPQQTAPVPLVARSDLRSITALLALVEWGVPALLLHPRWTEREQAQAMAEAQCSAIPWPESFESQSFIPCDQSPARAASFDPESTLAVVYTSGSIGGPKGALLSRRALSAAAQASAKNLGWQDNDRWLLSLPAAHVGGLSIVLRCLRAGRTVVLPTTAAANHAAGRTAGHAVSRDTSSRDISNTAQLYDDVLRQRVTLLSLVPTQLQRLLALDRPAPPTLRAVLLGGAPAAPDLLARAADAGYPVLTTYGLTECCSQVTTQPWGTVNRGALGSGPPLPETEVRIQPTETENKQREPDEKQTAPSRADRKPAGAQQALRKQRGVRDAAGKQAGRIQVRSPTLASGFVPDLPLPIDRDGWFTTSDIGELDSGGNLHVLGRADAVIISGGENVHPEEVEATLGLHPEVEAAIVFGVPDPDWGEQVAVAICGPISDEALQAYAAANLAGFKRPRQIARPAQLPTTPSGKISRRLAKQQCQPLLRPLRS